MANKEFSFKHFKKVSEDHNTATLKHPDGHEVKIAKKPLSNSLRDQLSKLQFDKKSAEECADGGEIEKKDDSIMALAKALKRLGSGEEKGVHQPSAKNPKGGTSVAGEYSQFGHPGSFMDGRPEAKRMHEDKLKELKSMKKPALMADGGDPDSAYQNLDQDTDQDVSQQASQPQAPAQVQQQPKPLNQQINQTMGAGLNPQAQPQDEIQRINQHAQEWSQDLANGHITPKTYGDLFADKGTLGKIGMIFGAALGGAGSGLAHQQNAFVGMMNNQIQNDLNAQMKSKENAQNYIKLAQQQVLNESQVKLNNAQTLQMARPLANIYANRAALDSLVKKYNALPDGSPLKAQYGRQLMVAMPQMDVQNSSFAARMAAIKAMYEQQNGGVSSPQGATQVPTAGSDQASAQGLGAPVGASVPPAGGQDQAPQAAPEIGGPSQMLSPNAHGVMDTIQYNPSIPADQKAIMTKEYQSQVNAEAGMKQVDDVFPKLSNEATYGQWLSDEGIAAAHNLDKVGSLAAGAAGALGIGKLIGMGGVPVAAETLGAAGAGAGAAAAGAGTAGAATLALPAAILGTMGIGAYMYMTKDQRIQYNADRKKLRSAIATSLKGVPGFEGGEAVDALVNAYTPTAFDSEEDKQRKAQNIKDVIRLHTKSTFLKDRGLSNN